MPPNEPLPPTRTAPLLLAICALALALRLPNYLESVWIDELYTSTIFTGDFVVLLKTLYSDIHPPLYFVLIHIWNAIFGDSELWLRMPPMLSGICSIPVLYAIGASVAGRATGFAAAFLLAVSPVHIWYSQEARPYATNVFLLLLTMLAFCRLLEGRRHFGWTLLYAVALFGVVFTHYYMAAFLLVLPAVAFLAKAENRTRVFWTSFWIGSLLVVYMGAKAFFSNVPTSKGYLRAFDLQEAWGLFFNWFVTGNSFTPIGATKGFGQELLIGVQAIFVTAFLFGAWRLLRKNAAKWLGISVVLAMLVLPVFLFGLQLAGLSNTYIERSALPSLPLFLLVAAAGIAGFRREAVQRSAAAVTSLACGAVLGAFFMNDGLWTVYKPNPDWRGAARYFASELDGNGEQRSLYTEYPSPTPLTYYDRRLQEVKNFEGNQQKLEKLLRTTEKVFTKEGFPGEWIHTTIRSRLDEFARNLEEDERDMHLRIHKLRPSNMPKPEESSFYVLVQSGTPSPIAEQLLADPGLQKTDEREFRWLKVYRLQRAR